MENLDAYTYWINESYYNHLISLGESAYNIHLSPEKTKQETVKIIVLKAPDEPKTLPE